MYLNIEMEEASDYDVIDIDSGIKIPLVQEADDETGKFICYLRDEDGNYILDKKLDKVVEFHFKGNIKLIKKENQWTKPK